jgi:hypothetical protein
MIEIVKAKLADNGAILCMSQYCNFNGDKCPLYDKCDYYLVDLTKVEKENDEGETK